MRIPYRDGCASAAAGARYWIVYSGGARDRRGAEGARQEIVQQMKNVRQMPTSVASAGNTQREEKSLDDAVFDKLLSQGAGLDELM